MIQENQVSHNLEKMKKTCYKELPLCWEVVNIRNLKNQKKTFFFNRKEGLICQTPLFQVSDFSAFSKTYNLGLNIESEELLQEELMKKVNESSGVAITDTHSKGLNLNSENKAYPTHSNTFLKKKRVVLSASSRFAKKRDTRKRPKKTGLMGSSKSYKESFAFSSDQSEGKGSSNSSENKRFSGRSSSKIVEEESEGSIVIVKEPVTTYSKPQGFSTNRPRSKAQYCKGNGPEDVLSKFIKESGLTIKVKIDSAVQNQYTCLITCHEFPEASSVCKHSNKQKAITQACQSFLSSMFPNTSWREIVNTIMK
mmetsp:Transcript_2984/g.3051  ORF Transcript_2984/g.3051 Transcript_2984/m.3051 type:complete len:310 (+) Transcript_2984:66-995(+)